MSKCKTGTHNLNKPLDRSLNRHASRMLDGRSRPAPPDYLWQALLAVNRLIKEQERRARQFPELFDYAYIQRQRAARQEADERVMRDLNRVYGLAPFQQKRLC
jgi:hypothetical protein